MPERFGPSSRTGQRRAGRHECRRTTMDASSQRGSSAGRRRWYFLFLLLPLAGVLLASGCGEARQPASEKQPVEVVVTTPVRNEVTDYQDFTGRLDALKTVDVRARVSGYVQTAPFKEGDEVREGDLLFQIDSRTYQADLN